MASGERKTFACEWILCPQTLIIVRAAGQVYLPKANGHMIEDLPFEALCPSAFSIARVGRRI